MYNICLGRLECNGNFTVPSFSFWDPHLFLLCLSLKKNTNETLYDNTYFDNNINHNSDKIKA